MIAYVEMCVADAPVTLAYLTEGWAFRQVAVAESPGRRSVLLHNGGVPLVVTSATSSRSPIADWVARHGDGVIDVAVYAPLHGFAERARAAGMRPVSLPPAEQRARVRVRGAGTLQHTVIEPGDDLPLLPPGFDWTFDLQPGPADPALCLAGIDHIALCLPTGELDETAAAYQRVFHLKVISSDDIDVGPSGMRSHILRGGGVTYVMAEPKPGRAPGQVGEFVELHQGGGVQHLAFGTADIVTAVRALTRRGVDFLDTPDSYYDELAGRMPRNPVAVERLEHLRQTRVLADRDELGWLYQIFARSPFQRGTVFFELIQRDGAYSFANGNVQNLFASREAVPALSPLTV